MLVGALGVALDFGDSLVVHVGPVELPHGAVGVNGLELLEVNGALLKKEKKGMRPKSRGVNWN